MEPTHWVAFIGSLAAGGIAVLTFWISLGKVWKTAEDAAITVAALTVKLDLLRVDLNDHKVDVARNYCTNGDLKSAIDAFTSCINRLDSRLESYVAALRRDHD